MHETGDPVYCQKRGPGVIERVQDPVGIVCRPLYIFFDSGKSCYFTETGREQPGDSKPTLTFLKKEKT